jgi:ATP-dependent Clp protease protease subunit
MKTEFEKFAIKDQGIGSSTLHAYQKFMAALPGVENSMTPYILEERELRATQMDIFSRMMMDRTLWIAGGVNDAMSTVVQAQLLFLDQQNNKKQIVMHIDSPGGSVKSGLSIVDVMEYIQAPIQTINTGMAASMGSVLLGAGTKGMRASLRFSVTMLHQSSGGAVGNIQDAEIIMIEWRKTNQILFDLLGGYCGKTAEQVIKDAQRDLWLSADEALAYGIIDEVLQPRVKNLPKTK